MTTMRVLFRPMLFTIRYSGMRPPEKYIVKMTPFMIGPASIASRRETTNAPMAVTSRFSVVPTTTKKSVFT